MPTGTLRADCGLKVVTWVFLMLFLFTMTMMTTIRIRQKNPAPTPTPIATLELDDSVYDPDDDNVALLLVELLTTSVQLP